MIGLNKSRNKGWCVFTVPKYDSGLHGVSKRDTVEENRTRRKDKKELWGKGKQEGRLIRPQEVLQLSSRVSAVHAEDSVPQNF